MKCKEVCSPRGSRGAGVRLRKDTGFELLRNPQSGTEMRRTGPGDGNGYGRRCDPRGEPFGLVPRGVEPGDDERASLDVADEPYDLIGGCLCGEMGQHQDVTREHR